MKTVIKVKAKSQGDCRGCVFYIPGRVTKENKFHQHCINGSYHAPQYCYKSITIYKEK